MFKFIYTLSVLAILQSSVFADPAIDQAKILFGKYERLSNSFNPALVDLYSDSAIVRIGRKSKDGRMQFINLNGKQAKAILVQAMPVAKARNDRDVYSQLTYKRIGKKVRIQGKRYNMPKKYTSPITLVVMPDAKNKWMIVEQYEEVQPQ